MPNTKSAERRVRNSARKQLLNQSVKSRLKTMEKKFMELVKAGQKEQAATALREVSSALDKATKGNVLHWATVDRKKSRLASQLNKVK